MRAVLFDLWETLITDAPELQRARQLWRATNLRAIFGAAGLPADLDALDAALGATLHSLSLLHDEGRDTDAAGRVRIFLEEYVSRGGTPPEHDAGGLIEEAICTIPEGLYPRLMPGASETLARVRERGFKTALVSNAGITTAPTLRRMLNHYELLPHLDALVFSDDLCLAKPSAGIFHTALDAIGCSPREALFLGDSPRHDVAGAQAAGMKAVLLGSKHTDGVTPDARVDTLQAFVEVLEEVR